MNMKFSFLTSHFPLPKDKQDEKSKGEGEEGGEEGGEEENGKKSSFLLGDKMGAVKG